MLYYAHRISLKSPTSSSFEMQACALPVNIDKIYVTNYWCVCFLIPISHQNGYSKFYVTQLFPNTFTWVRPGSLNVFWPRVVVGQWGATISRCPTHFSHLGETWQQIKEQLVRSSGGRHLQFATGITWLCYFQTYFGDSYLFIPILDYTNSLWARGSYKTIEGAHVSLSSRVYSALPMWCSVGVK